MNDKNGGREKFRLTDEQVQQYKDLGYVVAPNILSEDEMEVYRSRAREIVLGDHPEKAKKRIIKDVRVAKGIIPPPEDPEMGLWKITNPDRFDQTFFDYLETPKLLDAVECLIGEDIVSFLLMYIYKPPHIDAVHPYHQDAFYFPFEPHDLCIGAWIPLDDANADNGTLSVIPRSYSKASSATKCPKNSRTLFPSRPKALKETPTKSSST